ncbi:MULTISPECIES: hypothetical protein [unclassified Beijerinckia]|uniref:ImuA family protein n=1 Tax=unclassified Beijerinckia TaxID=2638183 RepID=UPI00089A221B|nr:MULTISPECIES: hypothetical protein [unclassified Beijerinckia]MDH7797751.1 protein ImuA [Beijerinckia sp. GAS462]SEC97363.1 protein ImuA [Beijerinckia sp. 28-YEA-48]
MARESLQALRRDLAALERTGMPQAVDFFSFGLPDVDEALGGGLVRGALHEVYAHSLRDIVSAAGFAATLAIRAAAHRPVVWVRQDFAETEAGSLSPAGLAELGLDPSQIILVKARDALGVLRASAEALACAPLGAVLVEPWGQPGVIDLVATRRLSLAAAATGVPALMLRPAAAPLPSAATTRWSVRALQSRALAADAPGFPAFEMSLLRHRAGMAGRAWRVEWNRDAECFRIRKRQIRDYPALSRPLGSLSVDRSAAAPAPAVASGEWRKSA